MWNCESVQVTGEASFGPATPAAKVMITLIDRRALDRECLARGLLATQPHLEISTFASLNEWEGEGHRQGGTSAVLLSIGGQSPDDPTVAAALGCLAHDFPDIPVIVLADSEAASHVLTALDHGARGYIPSSVELRVVIEVVNLVRAGGVYVPASSLTAARHEILAPEVDDQADPFDQLLTPRQAAVAEALRQGKANKIIAYELDLSESTVKVHIRAIMRKLHAHNRTEVAFKLNGLSPVGRTRERVLGLAAHRERLPNGLVPMPPEPLPLAPQSTVYG